ARSPAGWRPKPPPAASIPADLNAERKAGDAFLSAGIDAAGGGFGRHPAGERAIGDAGGVIPDAAPDHGEPDQNGERNDDPQIGAARRRNGRPAAAARHAFAVSLHNADGRFAGHRALSPLECGLSKTLAKTLAKTLLRTFFKTLGRACSPF